MRIARHGRPAYRRSDRAAQTKITICAVILYFPRI
jgi:hypothetical protein